MKLPARVLILLGGAALAWGAILAIGRTSGLQSADRARAEIAEQNAVTVTKAYKAARDSIPYLRTEARNNRMEADAARAVVSLYADSVARVSEAARDVLSDTSADVPTLRHALAAQVAATDSLAAAFARYRESIDIAFTAMDRLTLKQAEALAKADSALAAKDRVIIEWKAAATCRFLWMACPTRTQVAVGAIVTTLVVVQAAK